MACAKSPIPELCIFPPDEDLLQPQNLSTFTTDVNDDGFSSASSFTQLPSSPKSPRSGGLSPLRPADSPATGKGLERERFEALLKASKERNAALGGKKAVDLRKEIALKAHQSKQAERKALFLPKVIASPSDMILPDAYSDSQPSSQFSPYSVFESVSSENPTMISPQEPWIEQLDSRLQEVAHPKQAHNVVKFPTTKSCRDKRPNPLPSLDEIIARLSSHGQVAIPRANPEHAPSNGRRLPAFLLSDSRFKLSSRNPSQDNKFGAIASPHPRPVRAGRMNMTVGPYSQPGSRMITPEPRPIPSLQITSASPTSVEDTFTFNSRAHKSRNMLSAIRRRTSTSAMDAADYETGPWEARKGRRISAPPELSSFVRSGFEHPVLLMPGGF